MSILTANGLPDISINNPFKDAGQGVADHFYNNLSFNPTVEVLVILILMELKLLTVR